MTNGSGLTAEKMLAAMRALKAAPALGYSAMRISFSEHALEFTNERLFPDSRNRSRRIYKKLVKRFGGEFRRRPCIWRVGDEIIAHPVYKAELERQFQLTEPPAHMPPSPYLAGLDAMRLRYGPGFYPAYPHRYPLVVDTGS